MLIVLGIGFFCSAVYVLLTGLTVRQREVALSVRRPSATAPATSASWRRAGASTTGCSARSPRGWRR